ncbi:hypothetical protein Tco_1400996 [Tanacetum coccineum]
MIAYRLCWGLDIDIGNMSFSVVVKLTTSKNRREPNICYTRYLSLIIENMLGNNYKNDKLKTFKPHQISATSFKKPSASEVPLTSHMLKVSKLSPVPEESLILSSRGVNNDDTADKSLFRTSIVIEASSITQVADTQHAEELVATVDATNSIDASESVGDLGNQPKLADAENVQEPIDKEGVKDPGITSLGNVIFDELYGYYATRDADESPFDTESEIKFIGKEVPKPTTLSVSANITIFNLYILFVFW